MSNLGGSQTTMPSIQSIESELNQLIDFLRGKGVLQFSGYGVSLSLLPDAPISSTPAPAEEAPKQEAKRGRDGLTAEEQTELYGRPLSDTRV